MRFTRSVQEFLVGWRSRPTQPGGFSCCSGSPPSTFMGSAGTTRLGRKSGRAAASTGSPIDTSAASSSSGISARLPLLPLPGSKRSPVTWRYKRDKIRPGKQKNPCENAAKSQKADAKFASKNEMSNRLYKPKLGVYYTVAITPPHLPTT